MAQIAASVSNYKSLTTLDIGGCSPGKDGGAALCEALSHHNSIAKLALADAGLNHDATLGLCRALKGKHTLKQLDLSNNRKLDAEGALVVLTRSGGAGWGDFVIVSQAD